ncbi:UNVERIFIED_CONTAM: hypothetical protein GTU68_043811 [Idotea baltica]|nr:hypothetical protein [Idotea baltica]
MFRLDNKVAIITGGASGIGLEISRSFANQGAVVHIFELNIDQAEREADLIIASGGRAYCHKVDVSKQSMVEKAIDKIRLVQPIDILVNNAGISHIGTVESTLEEDMDKIYEINIKGVYNCMHCILPHFMNNEGGVIINIASIAATVGLADRFAYSMSKAAVLNMTLQVAKDYVKDNIRCNSISPARIHTPLVDGFIKENYAGKEEQVFDELSQTQPIGRMGKPSEVAAMAIYLASDEAAFTTGTDFPVDGGFIKLNTP